MKDFLFSKNLWVLDLLVCLLMAYVVGYGSTVAMDDPAEHERLFLIRGILAYLFAFVLGLVLQRFTGLSWIPSWVWLGIGGALARILFLQIFSFNSLVAYHFDFSSAVYTAILNIGYDVFIITTFNWFVWGMTGLISIFTARFLAYWFLVIIAAKPKSNNFPGSL